MTAAEERAEARSTAINSVPLLVDFHNAALAVVRMCQDLDGLPEHFTFEEANALAELCNRAGRPGRAQDLIHEWAARDEAAEAYAAELSTWGITGGNEKGWEITGEVVR